MEWSDKLKQKNRNLTESSLPGFILAAVVLVILLILFILDSSVYAGELEDLAPYKEDSCRAKCGQVGVYEYQMDMLDAQRSQAKSLKKIAEELRSIRIEMKRRRKK